MKDFSNASFPPETINIMEDAMDAAVATLPDPISSAHVKAIAETILRTAKDGERDPATLQRMRFCWSFKLRRAIERRQVENAVSGAASQPVHLSLSGVRTLAVNAPYVVALSRCLRRAQRQLTLTGLVLSIANKPHFGLTARKACVLENSRWPQNLQLETRSIKRSANTPKERSSP
jgi:hypothetical protein